MKQWLTAILLLAGGACTSVAMVPLLAQEPVREKPGDRTSAIVKRMTPEQREHARLHAARRGSLRWQTRLLDEKLSVDVISDYAGTATARTARATLTGMACSADAVFVARVSSSESFPTEDGTMLFTDYTLQLNDVLRTASKAKALTQKQSVVATRLGGSIVVDGAKVTMAWNAFPPLTTDQDYLFFVYVIPATRTFDIRQPDSVMKIDGGVIRSLSYMPTTDVNIATAGVELLQSKDWLAGATCR